MKEKSPDELFSRHRDTPFLGGVVVVPGEEGDGSVDHAHKTVVGYGYFVRVVTQVGEDVFGSGKRLLCVEVPVLAIEILHERVECFRVCKRLNASVEVDLPLTIGEIEIVEKLPSNLHGEGLDRDQELVACLDPFGKRVVETACGDDQVKVRMKAHILVPGMKDGGEAYVCLKPFPFSRQFSEGLGCGSEQDVVQDLLVVEDERVELMRKRDDHVKISGGQDTLTLCFKPFCALQGLAFGAVSIPA